MGQTRLVWVLRGVVLTGCWAAFGVAFLHPGLGRDAAGLAAVLTDTSALVVMKVAGPIHSCPGRHHAKNRWMRQQKAILAKVSQNAERLDGCERQLGNYDRAWSVLAGLAPGQWDPRHKKGLHLVREDGSEDGEGSRRAGLLAG